MVKSATSLTGNGLRDWIIQRVTAVILLLYTVFLVCFLICNQPIQFDVWAALFQNTVMRGFTFLALLSMVYHTWVGIWTVLTDYIKCPRLRLLLHILVILTLFSYLAWAVAVVWGFR